VINQAELAKKISTNKNNSSALIKRLHRLKLIKKQVSPKDRRISLIELTEKGHSLFLEAEKIADEVHSEVINELPPGSEGELIELLSLCTNNLTGKKK
jgi:DNA-binding MarR family transcriptional regulator